MHIRRETSREHVETTSSALTDDPTDEPPPDLPPIGRPLHEPPPLTATNSELAQDQVEAFVDWAAASLPEEEEDLRNALDAARANAYVVRAFIAEVERARPFDWSRAVVALTLLGSMRNLTALPFLVDFVRLPLPTEGTYASEGPLPDNEPIEASGLAMLQEIAVDGLALLGTQEANDEVVRVAVEHPSVSVRAEAIRAYIASRGQEGRDEIQGAIRPEDSVFLDRFENRDTPDGPPFDERLQEFLAQHPEAEQTLPEDPADAGVP